MKTKPKVVANRSALKIFIDTFKLAFEPIFGFKERDWYLEKIYHLEGRERKASIKAFSFANEITSFNQSALIDYIFDLAERHKTLRLAVSNKDVNSTKASLDELISHMNEGFFSSVFKNFQLLHKHFESRSSTPPRLAVMGNWRTEDKDMVITLFRDRPVNYSNVFLLGESSALSFCAAHGKPYVCNDIISEVAKGRFRNPRISIEAAKKYSRWSWAGSPRATLEKNWQKIWNTHSSDGSGEYRSTLIVPIFADNKNLGEQLRKKIKADDSDRLIFGYLSIDHTTENYFDVDIDIPATKMVANILAIFAFQRLRFTDFSETFSRAEKLADGEFFDNLKSVAREVIELQSNIIADQDEFIASEKKAHFGKSILLSADDLIVKIAEMQQELQMEGISEEIKITKEAELS